MEIEPTYNELLKEIDKLRQQLKALTENATQNSDQQNEKLFDNNGDYEAVNEELRQTNQELSIAKEKAEKGEILYRRLIENSPWGMHFYKFENGSLIFSGSNKAADKLLHVDNSQFIGKTIEEAFPPLVQTEIPFRYREAAEKGIVWTTEQISYHDNKITGAFEVIAFQTTPGNMVAVFNDITERKQHEKQLNEKNEEYEKLNRELILTNNELVKAKEHAEASELKIKQQAEEIENFFNCAIDLLCIANTGGYFERLNQEWQNLLGYTLEELKGKRFLDFIHPDDMAATLEAVSQLEGHNKILNFTNRYRCKNGSYKWIEWRSYPYGNKIYAAARDITERKRVEEELIKNELLTRTAIENLPIIFYMIDNDGLFKLSIGAGLKSLGLRPNQVVGLSVYDLYKDHPQIISSVKMALSGEMTTFESNVNGASHFNIVTPFSISNTRNGIVGVALDITERKQIELEAIMAKEKAEENDRLKTAFLQNMSHEIRTPMNAIMGFASLMSDNYNNRKQLEKFSKIIDLRCNDLLAIIDNILDISKIESGQSTLQMEVFNINDLYSELSSFFADYQIRTNKQHIELLMDNLLDENLTNIKTDKLKLKQILINLITNALKYTETGCVKCGCRPVKDKILFYVSDTGVGIPIDKHKFIFERFSRIDTIISGNYAGGTGLGLPIVKGLVDLLGGKVWLESECNKGTTFYFTIDYQKVKVTNIKTVSDEKKSHHFKGKISLLIVEDDEYNALYLQKLLKNHFSNIVVVGTGLDAIKLLYSQSFDLILMDVRLPDITGYEATKTILQHFPEQKIIAQTAFAENEEHLKAINAGCIDYISKPTKREQLLTIISKYL